MQPAVLSAVAGGGSLEHARNRIREISTQVFGDFWKIFPDHIYTTAAGICLTCNIIRAITAFRGFYVRCIWILNQIILFRNFFLAGIIFEKIFHGVQIRQKNFSGSAVTLKKLFFSAICRRKYSRENTPKIEKYPIGFEMSCIFSTTYLVFECLKLLFLETDGT